jgi:N-acetylmuramoyl-L-alanine amidase
MRFNIHAGHNPDGMTACGAIGLIKESTEARKVKDKLIEILKSAGHTVYDCTCNNGTSQNDVLKRIVSKCNEHDVDLDISIHFNAGADDENGNGKTTGVEAYVYDIKTAAWGYAGKICNEISMLGYKNRGVKINQSLYVLNNTKAPALLIECCFVDDKDDISIYSSEKMAEAIAAGLGVKSAKEDLEVVENSKIIVDEKEVSVKRILKDGTNYIAIRDIADAVGYSVGNNGNIAVLEKK